MLLIRGVFLPAGSSLSDQAQVLVNDELADARVGRGKEGEDDDDGEGEKLQRDILELSQALGNGVTSLVLLGHRAHHARSLAEHHLGGSAEHHLGGSAEHQLRRQAEHVGGDGRAHVDGG